MLYDVHAKTEDWLVSGRKKGEFFARDGQSIDVPLSIMPVRQGKLFLPSVSVFPLTAKGQPIVMGQLPSCETYHENAAVSLEVASAEGGEARFWLERGLGDAIML